MHRLGRTTLALAILLAGQAARAGVVNLTNSAEGENKARGLAEVRARLLAACTDRKGRPDPASFEIVAEKASTNPEVPKPYMWTAG